MRWIKRYYRLNKHTRQSRIGTIREKSTFCIIPISINGEVRWMMESIIKQEYCYNGPGYDYDEEYWWKNLEWVEPPVIFDSRKIKNNEDE